MSNNYYKENLIFLLDQKGITLSEFEDSISIPKIRIHDPSTNELIAISNYFNLDIDTLIKKNLKLKFQVDLKEIKFVVLDVDGTMTDGGMFYTESGDQIKKFNAKDGLAIRRRGANGLIFGIISHAFRSESIAQRAKLLNIEKVYVGQDKKMDVLKSWCQEMNLSLSQVAYIGDDINDLDIMSEVGLSACPADSVKEIKKISQIILTRKGGDACIREFLDEWLS